MKRRKTGGAATSSRAGRKTNGGIVARGQSTSSRTGDGIRGLLPLRQAGRERGTKWGQKKKKKEVRGGGGGLPPVRKREFHAKLRALQKRRTKAIASRKGGGATSSELE